MRKEILVGLLFLCCSKVEQETDCQGLYKDRLFVYFNKSVDTTYAGFLGANGNVKLDEKLINRINKSKYSIDCCLYDLRNQWDIVNALKDAHQRGVKIRLITEKQHRDRDCIKVLEKTGILVLDDGTEGYPLMHNKFLIFDYRDKSSKIDNWVWTGSYNVTDFGTESNSNNVIEVQDTEIAKAYTMEFEEMWGGGGDEPDLQRAKFSVLKSDNTLHEFIINGEKWELYFCPTDKVTQRMLEAVESADYSIYFCIFVFSRQQLCNLMKAKLDQGVDVRGVFDERAWDFWWSKSLDMRGEWNPKKSNHPWWPPAVVYKDNVSGSVGYRLLHDKYMIIDAGHPESDPIIITGSQNWSKSAIERNDENILIIRSTVIANQYLQHFWARYKEAGGEITVAISQN